MSAEARLSNHAFVCRKAISQCDHSVADVLPFAQIEALCILKTDIGEKPASFANKLHV